MQLLSPNPLQGRTPNTDSMVHAATTPAAITLCLCFSTELVKAAVAALVLGTILSATEQHANLSASVPQGFQCIPTSDLPAADILMFAQGLKNKTAELSSAQLSCLSRLLATKNLTDNFGSYPSDLLLFLDLAKVPDETCEEFYAQASHGNLDLLPRGSAQRTALLRGALACLEVRSSRLCSEQLSSLGALVCDMEPETITASDPSILENLKLCPELTGTQQDALNDVLLKGTTVYGNPLSWDLQTLQNLGPLLLALNQTTLSLVAEAAWEAFGRSIAATYVSQGRSQREKSLTILKAFAGPSASSHPRLKRSTDCCPSMPVTDSSISDFLFIFYENSKQFELCLSNKVLKTNLEHLVNQPLTTEFLLVMKKKLEQIYPQGIPEEQLKLLGPLSRLYTAEEISSWLVTSSDTLSALLKPADGKWESAQVQQLLSRYLALGGTLTGPLLWQMGGENLCNLQEEQVRQIPPEVIRTAGQLNISSCSQTKKDQLYRKAQEAFDGQAGTIRAYYCQIWPYLGGAPVNDLKDLAGAGVAIDMDLDTFLTLNPKELMKLSVLDVKHLLGENLPSLKEAENETSVICWVKRQSQWELDCTLGIHLQGGRVEPGPARTATTPPCPTASASITPTAIAPVPTTLPTVPTPVDSGSHPTTLSSTSSAKVPTPAKSTTPHPDTAATSAAVAPIATSTTQPPPTTRLASTTTSVTPCSIHQPFTSNKTTSPTLTFLTTILGPVNPNTTSPSSITPPAPTSKATTSSVATHNTSTPLAFMRPPAPGGATHFTLAIHNTTTLSTHNAPGTLVPNSTSAPSTTATEMSLPSHHPTPISNSTISTQKSIVTSTTKTTTLACKTGTPPAFLGPSSIASSIETTKETPTGMPELPRPTQGGYINLQPESGSGPQPSPCLLHLLAAIVGSSLVKVLL